MRISDWSSDVCSSDLLVVVARLDAGEARLAAGHGKLLLHGDPFGGGRESAGPRAPGCGSVLDCTRPDQAWEVPRQPAGAQPGEEGLAGGRVAPKPLLTGEVVGQRRTGRGWGRGRGG